MELYKSPEIRKLRSLQAAASQSWQNRRPTSAPISPAYNVFAPRSQIALTAPSCLIFDSPISPRHAAIGYLVREPSSPAPLRIVLQLAPYTPGSSAPCRPLPRSGNADAPRQRLPAPDIMESLLDGTSRSPRPLASSFLNHRSRRAMQPAKTSFASHRSLCLPASISNSHLAPQKASLPAGRCFPLAKPTPHIGALKPRTSRPRFSIASPRSPSLLASISESPIASPQYYRRTSGANGDSQDVHDRITHQAYTFFVSAHSSANYCAKTEGVLRYMQCLQFII